MGKRRKGVSKESYVKVVSEVPEDNPPPWGKSRYVKIKQSAIKNKLLNNKLKQSDLLILLWFMANAPWRNPWMRIDYEELSKGLGLHRDTVKRSVMKLVKLDLLIQRKNRKPEFRLNPKYIYKGHT